MQEFMELGRRLLADESGQTTAEYALVILGGWRRRHQELLRQDILATNEGSGITTGRGDKH